MSLIEVGPIRSPNPAYQIFEYKDEATGQPVFRVLGPNATWFGPFLTALMAVKFVKDQANDNDYQPPKHGPKFG